MVNKRAWIRILEALVAVGIIGGIIIMVIGEQRIQQANLTPKIYVAERAMLSSVQRNNSLRTEILNTSVPVEQGEAGFPQDVSDYIKVRTPEYINCTSKICNLTNSCNLKTQDNEIYSRAVAITTNSTEYKPRQLRLFCWTLN